MFLSLQFLSSLKGTMKEMPPFKTGNGKGCIIGSSQCKNKNKGSLVQIYYGLWDGACGLFKQLAIYSEEPHYCADPRPTNPASEACNTMFSNSLRALPDTPAVHHRGVCCDSLLGAPEVSTVLPCLSSHGCPELIFKHLKKTSLASPFFSGI